MRLSLRVARAVADGEHPTNGSSARRITLRWLSRSSPCGATFTCALRADALAAILIADKTDRLLVFGRVPPTSIGGENADVGSNFEVESGSRQGCLEPWSPVP